MITYKLFDLQPNLCTTALNHLAKRSGAVPFIVQTLQDILDKAPDAFWQAMGSISSQTIVEQVFASPQFNKHLQDSAKPPATKCDPKVNNDVISWISSFLSSLKPANRPAAAQTIVAQLFERINNRNLELAARLRCFETAVTVLLSTVMCFTGNQDDQKNVERLVLSDTLNLIGHRLDELLNPNDPALAEAVGQETRTNVLNLTKNAVALE
ncbi:DEAD-box type RNA helicase, partial [Exophiala xenobiotica]